MKFLFRPLPEILGMITKDIQRLRDPATFSIGIQIRLGDEVFSGTSTDMDLSRPEIAQYFLCAEQIEESLPRVLKEHRILWLLISDSIRLREAAYAMYGHKVLTRLDMRVGHSSVKDSKHVDTAGKIISDEHVEAFRVAIAENILLSMANVHVITRESGFGRTAAFTSLNPDGWLFDLSNKASSPRCRLGIDHTPLNESSSYHAGI